MKPILIAYCLMVGVSTPTKVKVHENEGEQWRVEDLSRTATPYVQWVQDSDCTNSPQSENIKDLKKIININFDRGLEILGLN